MKIKEISRECENMEELKLSEQDKEAFFKACKRGIYKELHARKLLTDQQLTQLLDDTY